MSPRKRDYYEVLGVPRDADQATLKRAYRELAFEFHPDQNADDVEAEARFKEVGEAYQVLSDPDKRAHYDRFGHEEGGGFGVDLTSFTELFDNLFGDLFGRKKQKQTGRDLRYTLELTFAEAALGTKKTIHFPGKVLCETCAGTGAKGGEAGLRTCQVCSGRGEVRLQQGFVGLSKKCSACQGAGKVAAEPCATCRGAAVVDKEREFEVSIPAGTEDGSTRRVAGQGEPGRRGGATGDLNVIIRVKPHPLFRREGGVIAVEVPISAALAALGGSIDVPTLDGKVEMKIPPGTQSGAIFRLRRKGLPVGKSGERGDAHVKIFVETPANLSERQRTLIAELAASLTPEQGPLQMAYKAKVEG